MASLTGQQINQTYEGLIKTENNDQVGATAVTLTDGVGNQLPIQVSTGGVNFPDGTVDFTGASVVGLSAPPGATGATGPSGVGATGATGSIGFTGATGAAGGTGATGAQGVSGAQGFTGATGLGSTGATGSQGAQGDAGNIGATGSGATGATGPQGVSGSNGFIGSTGATGPAGSAGLVSEPTYTDAMESAAALTPVIGGAEAQGNYAVAIGAGAKARQSSVAIGLTATTHSPTTSGIALADGNVYATRGISLGYNAAFSEAVQIGYNGLAENRAIAIGKNTYGLGDGVAIGNQARNINGSDRQITIGYYAIGGAYASVSIGNQSNVQQDYGVAIGSGALVGSSGTQGIAIGLNANAAVPKAVALGPDITASTPSYTTTRRLQLIDYASLDYADDTAAAAGGVPLGGVYHNSGAARIRTT